MLYIILKRGWKYGFLWRSRCCCCSYLNMCSYIKNNYNILLCLAVLILYLLNNIVLKNYTNGNINYFFICYFNDLLAPIFILAYTNIILKKATYNQLTYKNSIFLILLCSIIWECFTPLIKKVVLVILLILFVIY